MRSLDPSQARFLLDTVFLPTLDAEHRTNRRVMEAIPVDKGDYRPDNVSMGSLTLAWHLAATELRFLQAVSAGEFDLTARPLPEMVKNSADLANWYSEQFAIQREALAKTPDDTLAKVIDFRGILKMPAVLFVNFAVAHSIHHRGQLTMYLRPMGAKVPAIYGESFDSAAARKSVTNNG